MDSRKALLAAARKAKTLHLEKNTRKHKRPRLRRRPLKIDIQFSNFNSYCQCNACVPCHYRVNYEKTLLSRFQRSLDQPKSPFRDVLCYKHKGGHEQYVIRAFRKNYLKGNPNRIEFFSPFDMLSDRRLSLIITISKQF
jgi:hypothetical protein